MSTVAKRIVSCTLSFLLAISAGSYQLAGQQPAPGYSGQGAPLSADELQQLVAPIALYPDALVAQILGAATFPDQIAAANNFLKFNSSLSGAALMKAVDTEPWDPSVKALTQFPSVLGNLASNLSWASALGEAYHTQTADVMAAVQALRAKAYAAGNLKSSPQMTVVQESPQVIVIQPANPQVVYVPAYNPTVVYGTPYTTPGYSASTVAATGILAFGVGIAVGAAIAGGGGGCCGWSYSSWNCNWHGGTVVYGSTSYYGNNAWHGGYYGSSATAYGPNGTAHATTAYNPSTGTYARGGSVSTPYGTSGAAQAYNPNTGAYAQTHQTSNAYGSYGDTQYTKNGQTTYTQHQSTAQGSMSTLQSTDGAKGVAGTTANGQHYAEGESANGTKYADQNGTTYKNTGSGWQQTPNQPKSNTNYSNYDQRSSAENNASARGWGQQGRSGGSAYGGGESGWQSRANSARGSFSRGGGGGWGRR
ncbi:MAG TPA: DUF3300 domain-containing protein [Terriglobales bacterium]